MQNPLGVFGFLHFNIDSSRRRTLRLKFHFNRARVSLFLLGFTCTSIAVWSAVFAPPHSPFQKQACSTAEDKI